MHQILPSRALLAAALVIPVNALGAGAAFAQSAASASPGSVMVVHGLEGSDLGQGYLPTLPIDLKVDNFCVSRQPVQFGTVAGPFPLAAGMHKIEISLANTTAPCSNAAVLSSNVALTAGDQVAVVAARDTSGKPVAKVYGLTESKPVPSGDARVVAFHTADAPAVDVTLTATSGGKVTTIANLQPGKRSATVVPAFTGYVTHVLPTGTNTVVAGPISFSAADRGLDLLFVVGSAGGGSVTVISKEIPAVY